jgi:TPR repeat protein
VAASTGASTAREAKVVAAGEVARAPQAARAAEPARSASPAPAPVASQSLPPPNSPVAAIYDQLAARARAGDSRASCRLANDLAACRSLALLREQRDGFDRSLLQETGKAKPNEQRLKQLLGQQEQLNTRIADNERQCGGLSGERLDEAFDWLKLAADQGHVPSMARFASDPLIPLNRVVKELDRMLLYRANAPRYAQAALAAGNAEIVNALAEAYRTKSASGGTVLSQVLPADPVQSFAYSLLARRLAPGAVVQGNADPLELQRAELDPAQQADAQRLTDQLYDKYYAGRSLPPKPTTPSEQTSWWCERER